MEPLSPNSRPEINSQESTRLACACALTLGSRYRRGILRRARERYRATAPEIGLDYGLLILICKHLELRSTQYQIVYWVSILAGFLAAFVVPSIALGLFLIPLGAFFYKAFYDRFRLLPLFRSDRFDPDEVAQAFAVDLPPRLVEGVPLDQQNILAHSGINPFVGAGKRLEQWALSVDLSRPTQVSNKPVQEVDGAQVYGAIQAAVTRLQFPNMQIRDCAVVSGKKLYRDSAILRHPYDRPNQRVGATELRRMRGKTGSLRRHYKWIMIPDWGGEVVFSIFVRCVVRGDTLFVEVLHFVLPPIAPQFRGIDARLKPGLVSNLMWLAKTSLWAPFAIPLTLLDSLSKFLEGSWFTLGLQDASQRWQIRNVPSLDRGAQFSLREQMAGKFYAFFQESDFRLYDKTLEREIFDTVVDFLRDRGIDTSRLRQEQVTMTILNNSILMQGGHLQANNLAVGKGARAVAFKRLAASILPPSPK